MEKSNKDVFQHYKVWQGLPARQRPSFVGYLAAKSPWLFSHHPADACFHEHVWKFNGLYLCKGCIVTSIGFLFGIIFQGISGWLSLFSEIELGLIFAALLLPTVLTGLTASPRNLKHLSRFALGFLIASAAFLLFVTDRWDVRLVVIANYFVFKIALERKRQQQNAKLLSNCR